MKKIKHFQMSQTRDRLWGCASVITYWTFKCRDRKISPAMGINTWPFLKNSIKNASETANSIEGYIEKLAEKLKSHLRPGELTKILQPEQKIYRVNEDISEILEINADQDKGFVGWLDLIQEISIDGYTELDLLDLLRKYPGMIQAICKIKFEEEKMFGKEEPEEVIDVSATEL